MYKAFTLLLALFAVTCSFAQNIVYNPGFELYYHCPVYLNSLDSCNGWKKPTIGTPDYYNACGSSMAGIPSNLLGYQPAASGSAYAGIMTFSTLVSEFREYLMGRLMNMQAGQSYEVRIKVSASNLQKFASDGIGILFTVDSTYTHSTSSAPIPFPPQVDFSVYGVISDTLEWVTLTDTFFADSAYTHLTIGSFKSDFLVSIDTVAGSELLSYYYIDDVSVAPITTGIAGIATSRAVITIYPNPLGNSSEVRFSNPGKEAFTFCLYDLQGQVVKTIPDIRSEQFTIGKGDLVTGLYYYQLSSNCQRYVGKLQVE